MNICKTFHKAFSGRWETYNHWKQGSLMRCPCLEAWSAILAWFGADFSLLLFITYLKDGACLGSLFLFLLFENNSWCLTCISVTGVNTCFSSSVCKWCRRWLFLPNIHAENCFCLIHIWRLLSCLISFPFCRNESVQVLQLFPRPCFQRPLITFFYSSSLDFFYFVWVWFPDLD